MINRMKKGWSPFLVKKKWSHPACGLPSAVQKKHVLFLLKTLMWPVQKNVPWCGTKDRVRVSNR
jgi:hypothetical protein